MIDPLDSLIRPARRSWERVKAATDDADGQRTLRALWASIWAQALLEQVESYLRHEGGDARAETGPPLPHRLAPTNREVLISVAPHVTPADGTEANPESCRAVRRSILTLEESA